MLPPPHFEIVMALGFVHHDDDDDDDASNLFEFIFSIRQR